MQRSNDELTMAHMDLDEATSTAHAATRPRSPLTSLIRLPPNLPSKPAGIHTSRRERGKTYGGRLRPMVASKDWWKKHAWDVAFLVLSILVAVWAIYCSVRYFLALRDFWQEVLHVHSYTLAFGILSLFAALILVVEVVLFWFGPINSWFEQGLLLLASLALLVPCVAGVIFVALAREQQAKQLVSSLLLNDRCAQEVDILWIRDDGPSCEPGVSLAAWVIGAVFRLGITLFVMVALHILLYKVQRGKIHTFSRSRHAAPTLSATALVSSTVTLESRSHSGMSHTGNPVSLPDLKVATRSLYPPTGNTPKHVPVQALMKTNSAEKPPMPVPSPSTNQDGSFRVLGAMSPNAYAPIITDGRLTSPSVLSLPNQKRSGSSNSIPNAPTSHPQEESSCSSKATTDEQVDTDSDYDLEAMVAERVRSHFQTTVLPGRGNTMNNKSHSGTPPLSRSPPPFSQTPPPTSTTPTPSSSQAYPRPDLDSPPIYYHRYSDDEDQLRDQHDLMLMEMSMREQTHQHVVIFGSEVIRRMSTIASMGSGELEEGMDGGLGSRWRPRRWSRPLSVSNPPSPSTPAGTSGMRTSVSWTPSVNGNSSGLSRSTTASTMRNGDTRTPPCPGS